MQNVTKGCILRPLEFLPGVIVEMPLSRLRMFRIGGVVSAVESAAMIADGIAVVAGA